MQDFLKVLPVDSGQAQAVPWGQGCAAWFLLQTPQMQVVQEQMPPGTSEVVHYHQKTLQFFYVLQGELTIKIAGKNHVLTTEQGIVVPMGQHHEVKNCSQSQVRFLLISAPGCQQDRVTV